MCMCVCPTGEYIAVERVENVYKGCSLVEQIWVYGNSFESFLVAVVVPQEKPLRALAAEIGVQGADTVPLQVLTHTTHEHTRIDMRTELSWGCREYTQHHCRFGGTSPDCMCVCVVCVCVCVCVRAQELFKNDKLTAAALKQMQTLGRENKLKVRGCGCWGGVGCVCVSCVSCFSYQMDLVNLIATFSLPVCAHGCVCMCIYVCICVCVSYFHTRCPLLPCIAFFVYVCSRGLCTRCVRLNVYCACAVYPCACVCMCVSLCTHRVLRRSRLFTGRRSSSLWTMT